MEPQFSMFPHTPVTVEIKLPQGHPVVHVLNRFELERGDEGIRGWMDRGTEGQALLIRSLTVDHPELLKGETVNGNPFTVRATRSDDVIADEEFSFTYPLPITVIGALLQGVNVNPQLNAVVDSDGDVLTIMLIGAAGAWLRYSGQWVELTDVNHVDGLSAIPVKDEAIDVYDPLDQAGQVGNIALYPVRDDGEAIQPTGPGGALAASAVIGDLPIIATAEDVDAAVEAAMAVPEYRWYVAKRVQALGLDVELPW